MRGCGYSCPYSCLRCSPVWGVLQWRQTQSPTSLPSEPVLGAQGIPVPPPSHLWPLTPVHSHLQPLMPGNSHLHPLIPAHSLQGQWGRGGAFVSLRTHGWNILILHFLKVFDLISVFFFFLINVKFSYPNHNFMTIDSVFVRFL